MSAANFESRWTRRLRPLAAAVFAFAPAAHALQPLDSFVQGAKGFNPDNREVQATADQQAAAADIALGRALPQAQVRGTYTRNQYEVAIGPVPGIFPNKTYLQRFDQLDANFTVNVPLLDVASFVRITAARTGADAAREQRVAIALQVESNVVQNFYQLVADQALAAASERALSVSGENLKLTQTRFEGGSAAGLDVDRSKADVERQRQQLTGAQLQIQLAARSLESASGVTPDLSQKFELTDDLHEESELAQFERPFPELPSVAVAQLQRQSAEQSATSSRLALIPSLTGSFTEHLTNATSFVGKADSYLASVNVGWTFDFTTSATIRQGDALAAGARAREARAQLQARDSIFRAWATVASNIARSRSARAEQSSASHASQLAHDRYEAGSATQLDLLQAQRDAFSADVSRIQADAELVNARLQLRFSSGVDPFASNASKGN